MYVMTCIMHIFNKIINLLNMTIFLPICVDNFNINSFECLFFIIYMVYNDQCNFGYNEHYTLIGLKATFYTSFT